MTDVKQEIKTKYIAYDLTKFKDEFPQEVLHMIGKTRLHAPQRVFRFCTAGKSEPETMMFITDSVVCKFPQSIQSVFYFECPDARHSKAWTVIGQLSDLRYFCYEAPAQDNSVSDTLPIRCWIGSNYEIIEPCLSKRTKERFSKFQSIIQTVDKDLTMSRFHRRANLVFGM